MQTTRIILGALLLVALGKVGTADTLRCSSDQIVSSGDTTAAVLAKCGEPTQRTKSRECRKPHPGSPQAEGQQAFLAKDCVTVDVWTYNFGPYRLVHMLTFKNGLLTDMRTKGYGQ
jgi:hypothetical protein